MQPGQWLEQEPLGETLQNYPTGIQMKRKLRLIYNSETELNILQKYLNFGEKDREGKNKVQWGGTINS